MDTPFGAVPVELAWLMLRHTGPRASLALRRVSKATRAIVDAVYRRMSAGRITLLSANPATQGDTQASVLARLHAVRRLVGPAVVTVECAYELPFPAPHHVDALVAYIGAHPTDTVELSVASRPQLCRRTLDEPDEPVAQCLVALKGAVTRVAFTGPYIRKRHMRATLGLLPATLHGLRMYECALDRTDSAALAAALARLVDLRDLDLARNYIDFRAIAPPLAAMRELRELDLTRTVVDQPLLVGVLKATRQLERLVLHGSIRIGLTAGLAIELFAMPRLKSLRVSRCGVTVEALCAAAVATSPMEELDLSENHIFKSIDYTCLVALFTRLPRLTALHMQQDLYYDVDMLLSTLHALPHGARVLHLSDSGMDTIVAVDPRADRRARRRAERPALRMPGLALVWHSPLDYV